MTAISISSPVIAKIFKQVKNRVENIRQIEIEDDIFDTDIFEATQEFNSLE